MNVASFAMRYFAKPNAGKHTAHNLAVREAQGDLFIVLDSDDRCVPDALERLKSHWDAIPAEIRTEFSGVTVHCMDESGRVIGSRFPFDVMDDYPWRLHAQYDVRGEKWGFHRTEILREYLFPVIEREKFIPEGLIWNRIGRRYKIRFVNDALRIYRPSRDGLSSSAKARIESPNGTRLYYRECGTFNLPVWKKLRNVLNYARFSMHAGIGIKRLVADSEVKIVTAALVPAAYLAFTIDRYVSRRRGL